MWSTFVWYFAYIIIISGLFSEKHKSLADSRLVLPTSIPDIEYEQVIAKRYLFAPFANESTAWPVLTNIHNVYQVVSLPQYYAQAAEGFWLLTQSTNSTVETLQMSWMSLSDNNTSVVLSKMDTKSFLVVSHNKTVAMIYTAALISLERVKFILCNHLDATSCRIIKSIPFPSDLANISNITAGLFIDDLGTAGWLYIATDTGLHGLDLSTFIIHPYINEINVSASSLAWSSQHQTVFIGTETKLWIQSYAADDKGWRFEHVTGLIDAPITSLVYSDGQDKLWIGQETGITLLSPIIMSTGRIHWFFSRLAGQISNPGSDIGHLPFANITTLSVSHSTLPDSRVWLGTIRGMMRFHPNDTDINAWRVFNSARYMPNRDSLVNVVSLAVLSRESKAPTALGSTAVAVTSKGLAVLHFEMWTLAQKAKYFQEFFNQTGRHDKYNLVSGCGMSSWGDSRTCVKGPDDNDGLWTSMYLSSQIFRYRVTQDATVKASAWTHFEALELLNKVTGISGYPARSFAKRTDFPPGPNWYLSPVYPTLQFKDDTSSDEIVGHEFVYPLVHDLLVSNEDERQRAYTLLFNITNYILTHDWYLVGLNYTHRGVWNPIDINNGSDHIDERGLGSLEILAFLLQTYAYSGDERFLNGANLLIESYQYDVNLINQRMIAVCQVKFWDDELAYLSYFNLVYAINTFTSMPTLSTTQKERTQLVIDKLLEYMKVGLDLAHKYKQMEKSPFYNFIYCYVSGQVNQTRHLFNKSRGSSPEFDCNSLSKDGIWYMQRWPLELINWPQFNSDRLDIQLNVPAECDWGRALRSLKMLPPDERTISIWNYNVYDLDGGDGFLETDPTAFLISYWGMRYFNLLGE
ncbi:unnamed protein product [Rotaria sp. Silwood1]|nr:unnamed protein product [Rotaria sp. Silwood1]CAF3792818.1 unnamed protein product [Rotaria sp. Silwood1]CAF3836738.1 unnamed protein product [Rotaria sp. Silwood1]CAF4653209.1 unnamed protein product [Rotaria sp. Silwood1]CAF4793068.1 unnamed protein product [Rotaria sp. Silwood1]